MLDALTAVGVFLLAIGSWGLAIRFWDAGSRNLRLLSMACLIWGCLAVWYWIGLIEPLID
jgi:hypothetical protein